MPVTIYENTCYALGNYVGAPAFITASFVCGTYTPSTGATIDPSTLSANLAALLGNPAAVIITPPMFEFRGVAVGGIFPSPWKSGGTWYIRMYQASGAEATQAMLAATQLPATFSMLAIG